MNSTSVPSAVSTLSVSENGTSCLEVEWSLSPNSGADSFILRYAQLHSVSNNSVTLPEKDRSIHLCDGIQPGTVYVISVVVKKRNSLSEEKVVTYAVRPLSPVDFQISPDITKGKYRLTADLSTQSKYDGCRVSVVSETLEKVDADGELEDDGGNKSCNVLLPLIPGERFEFTLSTFSNNVTSSKLHRSVVLTPAFDMSGFGLSLQVVGLDSKLQMRLFPTVGASNGRRLSGDPLHASPLVMGGLTKGSCYKIQIFTVTKSGIVSETRFNEHFRLSAPPVNVSVNTITRTSAALQAAFVSSVSAPGPEDADGECFLNIVVLDMHSHVVLDKTLRAQSNAFSAVELNGLRPFHKYTVNSKGESSSPRSLNVGVGTDRADHFIETVVDGLAGGERYNFVVRAATEAGSGDLPSNSPESVKMPIMAPPRTNLVPTVAPESITSHSLTVKYSSAMFDAKHGKIIKSALLVAEVTEDGRVSETWMNSENVTYTWMQVQRFDVWPLYTAVVDESPPDQLNMVTLTQSKYLRVRVIASASSTDYSVTSLMTSPADRWFHRIELQQTMLCYMELPAHQ
ncbi:fibronectin type III domain protein [Ancylostoma duodenale]|uniref:Fibronectin type III domain protein n=1 Tax=Ancylostoma duodenale TaxID=51022 RepID=A0A0C2BUA7_9BILA|nr:fibronectin type III domain protein [Ancylostoma duodenale]